MSKIDDKADQVKYAVDKAAEAVKAFAKATAHSTRRITFKRLVRGGAFVSWPSC
jgi:hypothetical protein